MAEFAVVDRVCSKGADLRAVPQHCHALGDLKHFVESVAHEYDADAGAFQVADELDQGIDLVACQRCCRLIHDKELGIRCQRTADRDELTPSNAEVGDFRFWIEFNTDLRHCGPGGCAHRGPVNRAEAAKMVRHRDVFGDIEIGK